MAQPKLGTKARDRDTGFGGTVTAEFRNDQGRQFKLETLDKDGKPVEMWVSAKRIVIDDADAGARAQRPRED